MNFKDLSEWILLESGSATRIIKNGNVEDVKDRVAFIEKSPRVRLSKRKYCVEEKEGGACQSMNNDAWIYGDKGSDYGLDEKSREWCDRMLILLGWE